MKQVIALTFLGYVAQATSYKKTELSQVTRHELPGTNLAESEGWWIFGQSSKNDTSEGIESDSSSNEKVVELELDEDFAKEEMIDIGMQDRAEIMREAIDKYLDFLNVEDQKHEFSYFKDCTNCFYEYQDLISLMEQASANFDEIAVQIEDLETENLDKDHV
jgi:hypothetical protein